LRSPAGTQHGDKQFERKSLDGERRERVRVFDFMRHATRDRMRYGIATVRDAVKQRSRLTQPISGVSVGFHDDLQRPGEFIPMWLPHRLE
jgi:hypothetical protein